MVIQHFKVPIAHSYMACAQTRQYLWHRIQMFVSLKHVATSSFCFQSYTPVRRDFFWGGRGEPN